MTSIECSDISIETRVSRYSLIRLGKLVNFPVRKMAIVGLFSTISGSFDGVKLPCIISLGSFSTARVNWYSSSRVKGSLIALPIKSRSWQRYTQIIPTISYREVSLRQQHGCPYT